MIAAILAGMKALGEATLKNIANGSGAQQQESQASGAQPYSPAPSPPVAPVSPYDPGPPQLPTMTGMPKAPMVAAPQIQDPNKRKLDVLNGSQIY